MISIDDFKKLEIKIGHILTAEKVPNSDKLLKLSVDFGFKPQANSDEQTTEHDVRQIVSGISKYFSDPQDLVGKKCAFATNLEPRAIMGLESQGMILAVSGDSFFSLLETSQDVAPGSAVK